jgi:hypothetical protein
MNTQTEAPACKHIWIANSGHGGEPDFRMNRQMSDQPLMHVKCLQCRGRTWLTHEQWEAMSEAADDSA